MSRRRFTNSPGRDVDDSGASRFADRIKAAKTASYETHVVYASKPTELAAEGAKARAESTRRAVPLDGLEAMHANVLRFFPEVEALLESGDLDSLQLWDTRDPKGK